jgi:uncharacterized membrane protein YjgN (DUF898 family)
MMKNYLKFNLTGEKLFPILFLVIVLIVFPICFIAWEVAQYNLIHNKDGLVLIPIVLSFLILPFLLCYYVEKMKIESFEFDGKSVEFTGTFKEFAKLFFIGLLLSIITVGVYLPWFMKNMQKFFINNSSYEGYRPEFLGKGFKLFLIFTLLALVPSVFGSIMDNAIKVFHQPLLIFVVGGVVMVVKMIIMSPFYYFQYRWYFDARFKGLTILWNTDTWDSILEIIKQSLLMFFTFGIYFPVGYLKLYKYFAERTVAVNENENYHLGYDLEPMADFKFIWGQALMTIITIGIYFPWAYCKVMNRVVAKTYIIKN